MTLREIAFQLGATMIAIVGVLIIFTAFVEIVLAFFGHEKEQDVPALTDAEETFNQFYRLLYEKDRCAFTQEEAWQLYGVWQRQASTATERTNRQEDMMI